jgi:uridine phosphorylase
MSVPQLRGKHRSKPLFRAADFHRYVARRTGRPPPRSPRTVVMVFGQRWAPYLDRKYGKTRDRRSGIYRVRRGVGIVHVTGPGAPYAGIIMEEVAALGAKRFVAFGIAGSLQPELRSGTLVLCDRALRDEGTSHHYAPAGPFARPTRELTEAIARALDLDGTPFARGATWTIDSPYRETVAEIRRYRRRGILTVEMEASALFTIARHHHLEAAALFVISDLLVEKGWEPRFHDTRTVLRRYLALLVDSLAG